MASSVTTKEFAESVSDAGDKGVYEPLPDGDYIRYMTLKPGTVNAPLVCELHVKNLRDASEYEAISYVWGSSRRDHELLIGDNIVKITANLDDTLRHLRLLNQDRNLWADSVCINQDDIEERGKQVMLMGKIYSCSPRVLMYIGPDINHDGQAVASIISELDEMVLKGINEASLNWNTFQWPTEKEREHLLADRRWNSVMNMTYQPWFTRGWVIQEAALSQTGMMIWGSIEISWTKIIRVYTWMIRRLPEVRRQYLSNTKGMNRLHIEMYRMLNMEETMPLYPHTPPIFDFLIILHDARALSVHNQKDRIYAFLSLAQRANIPIVINPDYSELTTAADVYLDFAREYIRVTMNVRMLHCVQHTEDTVNAPFPSWVPRWDLNLFNNIVTHTSVSPLMPSSLGPVVLSGNLLKVTGVIFDRVAFMSNLFKHDAGIDDVASVWKALSDINPISAYGKSLQATAFGHILAIGRSWAAPWREWCSWRAAYMRLLQGAFPMGEAVERDRGIKNFHSYARCNLHNRRIVLTERGYYGLAPGLVNEKDLCCVIAGANAPCILRATSLPGHYRLIGDACVPGKDSEQNGENIRSIGAKDQRNWEEWGATEQDIYLC